MKSKKMEIPKEIVKTTVSSLIKAGKVVVGGMGNFFRNLSNVKFK